MVNLEEPEIKVRDERAVRRTLIEVRNRHPEKLLTAEEVVKTAEPEDSPLHEYFEWDDTEAARQHRLSQARVLIRHIKVTMPDDRTETPINRWVSLRRDRGRRPGGGYRDIGEVLSSAELLTELEETAKKDLEGFLRRYEMLKSFCQRVRRAAGIQTRKAAKKQRAQQRTGS